MEKLSINNRELSVEELEREREIKMIVIHCSATRCNVSFSPRQLEACHKARGFRTIGYHFYIIRDGSVYRTRPVSEVGAHAAGFNLNSIGICYEGGLSPDGVAADTRTVFQQTSLLGLLGALKKQYPGVVIKGHYQLSADVHKACPCFDAEREYRDL